MNHTTKIHSEERLVRLAALSILVVIFTSVLSVATNCLAQNYSSNAVSHLYDDFNEKWRPCALADRGSGCWAGRWSVSRQIQNGRLYLAARNIGWNGGNSDTHWSQSDLSFPNANSITSITADVTVRSASGTNCPLHRNREPKFVSEERSSTAAAGI